MFNIEYATDTYSVFNFNADQVYNQFAMSGRFITAIVGRCVKLLGFSEQAIYLGSFILAIISVLICQFKIYKIIKNDVKNKDFRMLIALLIIVNPFSIELFLFIEKGIMWFGVLMAICAVEQVIKYLDSNKKRYIIYSIIFMFLANCSYQGVVGIFVAISLIYVLKYSKNIKDFLINNLIIGVIYIIPATVDYVLIKILYQGSRLNGQTIIVDSILKIFNGTIQMITGTYGILPKFLFIWCIGIIFICLLVQIVQKKKNYVKEVIKVLYIIFGTIVITVAPQIMQPTTSIWFVARSTYSFGALYGILILYLYLKFPPKKMVSIVVILTSILLIIFQYTKFTTIVNDRYRLNQIDYEISMLIVDKIKSYEQVTQNEITKLEIYSDKNPSYTYDGIFATGDTNVKAYGTDWSTEAILEYYLKRDLQVTEKNDELNKSFIYQDWNDFDIDKQVLIREDTVVICRY